MMHESALSTGRRPLLLDERREIASCDVFHHQEVNAVGLVGIIGGNDVGMPQLGGRFDLPLKSPQRFRRIGDLGG